MTVTVVTGANSGIGRATALHLATLGHTVHAGMRRLESGTKLLERAEALGVTVQPFVIDVADDASVRDGLGAVLAAGPVDVLVNNAGVGHNSATEDVDIDDAKLVFDVNYWGAMRCIQAVLPAMRDAGSGAIVNISSVAGRVSSLGQVVYSSSKWALEALSEGLAQEVAPFGVQVKIIEPGVTRTAILPKNIEHPDNPANATAYRRMLAMYAAGMVADVQAEVVAEVVADALADSSDRLRYTCAWGGAELVGGRAAMTDEDWVGLGRIESDADYYDRFEALFGLDIRMPE